MSAKREVQEYIYKGHKVRIEPRADGPEWDLLVDGNYEGTWVYLRYVRAAAKDVINLVEGLV